jgi:SmpA/OmlA family protein
MSKRRARKIIEIAALVATVTACAERGSSLGPLVTRDGIRAIKVGMTRREVEAVFGPPVTFSKQFEDSQSDRWHLMTYSRAVFRAKQYPMLWIHLEDGRVRSVYAKAYAWNMNGRPLYCHSKSENWEFPEFEEMFPD